MGRVGVVLIRPFFILSQDSDGEAWSAFQNPDRVVGCRGCHRSFSTR